MLLKRSNEIDLEKDDKIKNNKKRRKVCETTIDKFKEVRINMYVQEICNGPMTLNF
jgi:hypothetical protein